MGKDMYSHRPSSLHQTNKTFKSKHASKGQVKKKNKGKIERLSMASKKSMQYLSKADRRNAAKLTQIRKRQEFTEAQRRIGHVNGAPKIVLVVGLSQEINVATALDRLCQMSNAPQSAEWYNISQNGMEDASVQKRLVYLERLKQKCVLMTTDREIMAVLVAATVADFLIVVLSAAYGCIRRVDNYLYQSTRTTIIYDVATGKDFA
jgi:pre-rRNA-processing protein TSR1